jgi:ribosomal protein S18 acetylase RimI-like enzyme
MPQATLVRPLAVSDVDDYRTIRLAALGTAPEAFGSTHALEASRPDERHAERLASSLVMAAYAGGRIVGMIGFRREPGPRTAHKGSIWGFYVEPGQRGRGVGSALLSALLAALRGVVEQVTLSVVAENAAAIALYERFGFARYGLEPRALKDASGWSDEALMVLFLDDPAADRGP